MQGTDALHEPSVLRSGRAERYAIIYHIRRQAEGQGVLSILDAGCGRRRWLFLRDIPCTVTGIDIDEEALAYRHSEHVSLDRTIVGDVRTVTLEGECFDVILCRHVLEHVAGAERALENLVSWLRPGGIILLSIPNRDSVHGFVTRITPFRLHAYCKRHILGIKHAGQPGHGPSPKVFDKVVSRRGVSDFCCRHGLTIRAEYSWGTALAEEGRRVFRILVNVMMGLVHLASLGRLSTHHAGLLYVIEKAQVSRTPALHGDAPPLR